MGKAPTHARIKNDWYPTPAHSVAPLVPHLPTRPFTYMNPCAGKGHGIARIAEQAPQGLCTAAFWIPGNGTEPPHLPPQPGRIVHGCSWDADDPCAWPSEADAEMIISNPVFRWDWLEPLLARAIEDGRPSWWLLPTDKLFTDRWSRCVGDAARLTVPIGRVMWFENSPAASTQNYAWVKLSPREIGHNIILPKVATGWNKSKDRFEDAPVLISQYWRMKVEDAA